MASLPFRTLVGINLRKTLTVDCAYVEDITRTRTIFECLCPVDMKVVSLNKCFGNGEQPCCWEVMYMYKPETQKVCTPEDVKNAYKEIFKMLPLNVTVKESDKQIIGVPPKYRVQYNVNTCTCAKLDFELYHFNLKLND